MDFSGRVGGRPRGGRRDVDEFGRERRSRPHNRTPYDRPSRGRGPRGGRNNGQSNDGMDIEKRLSSLIIKVGDKNTPTLQNNLEALSVVLEKDYSKHESTVLKTFRQCVLELPWKVTVYSTLAGLLNAKNAETGKKVVEVIHGVLRRALETGDWSSVKVLMRFFSLLVTTNAISAQTLVAMYDALLQPACISGEIALSKRADCLVYIVMSSLLWSGKALSEHASSDLERISTLVEKYVAQHIEANSENSLTRVFHDIQPKDCNILGFMLDILRSASTSGWSLDAIVTPYDMFTTEFSQATQCDLPSLELPTDLPLSAYYTPSEFVQLVPSPADCAVRKFILQDFISDTITQLEGNRKDCARYLLQIHHLCNEDVCSVMTTMQHPEDIDLDSSLVFEYLVSEVLFSLLLQLPEGLYREMYYTCLAIELRKSEPQIMADVFSTTIENIIARSQSLDIECINRLSNWLAVYISNFGYQWDWAKWEQLVAEPEKSPKRCFLHETLLKTIRLSYLDRIKAMLPEGYHAIIPEKPPSHNFKFTIQAMDERTKDVSVAMGKCLKTKGTADQALEILDDHYSKWTDIVDDDERKSLAREMLVEHVLLLGSKTFSHMLNAIEKFMPALQRFGDSPETKLHIAKVTEHFWMNHPQFFAITIDKLVNYRVIDPITVVDMVFDQAHVGSWSKFYHWEILHNTIKKVNLRVEQLQARLVAARASADTMMDENVGDDDSEQQQQQPPENPEQVENTLNQIVQEQKDVVISMCKYFVHYMSDQNEGTDDADELDSAWLVGRFKEFMRSYRVQIAELAQTLETLVFTAEVSADIRQVFHSTCSLYS